MIPDSVPTPPVTNLDSDLDGADLASQDSSCEEMEMTLPPVGAEEETLGDVSSCESVLTAASYDPTNLGGKHEVSNRNLGSWGGQNKNIYLSGLKFSVTF